LPFLLESRNASQFAESTKQEYSEPEENNLNEIEELLNRSSNYIAIAPGEKKVLRFLPEKRIEEVEKTYNGQTVRKIRFIAIDTDSGSSEEKIFDVGRRSARLIIAKLKEGYTRLKIERIGSGKDTLYIPTEITE
jgi:hypothetical protein